MEQSQQATLDLFKIASDIETLMMYLTPARAVLGEIASQTARTDKSLHAHEVAHLNHMLQAAELLLSQATTDIDALSSRLYEQHRKGKGESE